MKKFLLSVVLFLLAFYSYAQDPCVPPPANFYDKGTDYWKAYVYQLDPHYSGDNVTREFPDDWYRGMLPYRPNFLPHNSNMERVYIRDFDINFGDTGAQSTDENYFTTIRTYNDPNSQGCPVQLQDFGVVFRTKFTVPSNGIYRITIGSDDGSFLKHGNDTIHDNWGTGRTYVYEENVFNYYRAYEAGQVLEYDLSYYEKKGSNRVSFSFVKYIGPGEIEGRQDVCGINPDPEPFGSRGPAAFEQGGAEDITYQWQYEEGGGWINVEGATGLTYKVPRYVKGDEERGWSGSRRYRRMAILTIDGESTSTPTDPVEININPFPEDLDREEHGDNTWIGHVYRGIGVFTEDNYAGTIWEDSDSFRQDFGGSSLLNYQYPVGYGCNIVTTNFSVRYKMKLDVSPGTYTFQVRGDDGFRLSVDGGESWIINDWKNGPASEQYTTADVEIDLTGHLDLVLDYYENTQGNLLDFRYDFKPLILPLEWGQVSAEACGPDNCLTWETIQEKNTSHFELERSYNGADWEMFDSSVQAQGNSTAMYTYHFTDKRVMASKIYYRIKQVDLDEAYEYSEVMRVDNPHYVKSFLPYPNPTMDKIRIFSQATVVGVSLVSNDYSVFRSVNSTRLHDNRYEIDLAGLKPGNYVVMVQKEGGETETFKVIKK